MDNTLLHVAHHNFFQIQLVKMINIFISDSHVIQRHISNISEGLLQHRQMGSNEVHEAHEQGVHSDDHNSKISEWPELEEICQNATFPLRMIEGYPAIERQLLAICCRAIFVHGIKALWPKSQGYKCDYVTCQRYGVCQNEKHPGQSIIPLFCFLDYLFWIEFIQNFIVEP